jgi:hypothetical protein
MKSRQKRCESGAAPSTGGPPAFRTALHFPRHLDSDPRHSHAVRARPWGLAWPLCVWLIVLACFASVPRLAHAAGPVVAGPATPVIPALQSLINSATVTPASDAASAAEAASAPSPASQAELAHSLDSVISTLDNDRQRTALVAQLKKLRDVSRTVAPAPPAQPSPGLLGAIASGIASFESGMHQGRTPLRYWAGRFNAAGDELFTIVTSQGPESLGKILLDMAAMLAGWGLCAWALIYVQRRLH